MEELSYIVQQHLSNKIMMKLPRETLGEQTETVQIYSELKVPWYNEWQLNLGESTHALLRSHLQNMHEHQNTSTPESGYKDECSDQQNVESEK